MNAQRSITRAIKLLNSPPKYEEYISIKITPVIRGCCCFHCWPKTWNAINRYIHNKYGFIRDEGDVLIQTGDNKFVLECHESGPEIIIYLGLVVDSISLIAFIFKLIRFLFKIREKEDRNMLRYKVLIIHNKHLVEEVELKLPLSSLALRKIRNHLKKAFNNR